MLRFLLVISILFFSAEAVISQDEVTKSIKFHSAGYENGSSVNGELVLKNEKGEYFIFTHNNSGVNSADYVIGEDTIAYKHFPIDQQNPHGGSGGVAYLIKLSKDLQFIDVVTFRNFNSSEIDVSLSQDRLFLSATQWSDNYYYIDDTYVPVDKDRKGTVYGFDHDLAYLGVQFQCDHGIENIATSGDSTLYINAQFRGPDTTVFQNDTLFSFSPYLLSMKTNYIVNYNYRENQVESFWRYGSYGDDSAVNMEVDTNGNLYLGGYFESEYFTFDDSIWIDNVFGDTNYLVKFSPSGEVIWHYNDEASNSSKIISFGLLDDNSVLTFQSFAVSTFLLLDGDTTYVDSYPNDEFGNRVVAVKYDATGKFDWFYMLQGLNSYAGFDAFQEYDETIEFFQRVSAQELSLGASEYQDIESAQVFVTLDKNSGSFVDGNLYEVNHDVVNETLLCKYIERCDTSDQVRMLYSFRFAEDELFGESWISAGQTAHYLIELNGELLSDVIDTHSANLFDFYPNPIQSQENLMITTQSQDTGTLMIFSSDGKEVVRRDLSVHQSKHEIRLPNLTPGTYVIRYQTIESHQSKLLIVSK